MMLKRFWRDLCGAVRKSRLVMISAAGAMVLTPLGLYQSGYTKHWESGTKVYHYAYLDVGGVPTVCDGHTGADVVMKKYYSDADCDALRLKDIAAAEARFTACFPASDDLSWLPNDPYVAFVDATLNLGQQCGSHFMAALKAHDIKAACMALSPWVHVGKNVIPGLVKRRVTGDGSSTPSEQQLCLRGVK